MAVLSKSEVPPWGLAVAGSSGAIMANALVYPLDMVKTKLQVQVKRHPTDTTDHGGDPHYTGTMHAILSIIEEEGLRGLYSGMFGSLLGVASTNFAYFYWYSTVRQLYFDKVQKSSKAPSTAVELSLGALAGALAQLFTIPVAVVTTRQQTQRKGERKGMFATAKEVIDSEDGYSGLWRGLKASLILVVNPAITYGAYQRLREIIYPNKVNLRAHEAFRKSILWKNAGASLMFHNSPGCNVQSDGDNRHATAHRRQSRPAIPTASKPARQALQVFPRSNGTHR